MERQGSKFFFENGTQFFIKGIAYQQEVPSSGPLSNRSYIDPLADPTGCKRVIPILAAAGTNTIRVYAVEPKADHTECMKLLQEAGIYVIADLSEPRTSINREEPAWDTRLYARYTAVIDELAPFPNVLGFFAGNEVTNNEHNTDASAFVKAAVRDMKAYIAHGTYDRWIGVGYAANDDAAIRADIASYFNCGRPEESVDFFGYNIYEWCGHSSIDESGYKKQVDFFANYSVPVFFAEYGCNVPGGAEGRL